MEKPITLYDLIDMSSEDAIHAEVKHVFALAFPDHPLQRLEHAFRTSVMLHNGEHPAYQASNIGYHDLWHTLETYLATARLSHGALLEALPVSAELMELSSVAALFHDIGYLQVADDANGTGAKYTRNHVPRGIDIVRQLADHLGLSDRELEIIASLMLSTDLAVDFAGIPFTDASEALAGKVVGTCDLMAQMGDRTYLEKLRFLYEEFEEGQVPGFDSDLDLLHKTPGFYAFIMQRLDNTFDKVRHHMAAHFKARWNIAEDLYFVSMHNQQTYLKKVLEESASSPFEHFKRTPQNVPVS